MNYHTTTSSGNPHCECGEVEKWPVRELNLYRKAHGFTIIGGNLEKWALFGVIITNTTKRLIKVKWNHSGWRIRKWRGWQRQCFVVVDDVLFRMERVVLWLFSSIPLQIRWTNNYCCSSSVRAEVPWQIPTEYWYWWWSGWEGGSWKLLPRQWGEIIKIL